MSAKCRIIVNTKISSTVMRFCGEKRWLRGGKNDRTGISNRDLSGHVYTYYYRKMGASCDYTGLWSDDTSSGIWAEYA